MTLQSGQTSEFKLPSHLQLSPESCPTCGQAIPPDKLEEISGRINARERERTRAITAQLDMQYAADKARVEANAKADVEEERQQSIVRQARVRDEAQKAAEKLISERQVEAEHARSELEAGWRQQLAEARANGIAAEQEGTTLALQLDELRQAKESEVAKIKEETATEVLRIRQVAAEEAETRSRDTIRGYENAAAEAKAKAREAEAKVLALTNQHAGAMEASLNEQREILERAKEDAVNTERAKAFEENQKLSNKVNDLQRAMENKSAEELGEGAEINVFEALKAEFPEDRISRIRKGAPGADILHVVMLGGKECGTILYDSKNHKQFRNEHVDKLGADKLAARAEHAILSTHKFPQGAGQLHIQDGVLLANPARVVFLATIVRQHLLHIHTLRLSNVERETKTAALYEFIISERCTQLLGRIDERAGSLLEQQGKEIRWHQNNWRRQAEAVRAIQKAKVDLSSEIDSIIGTSGDDAGMLEAS